MTASHSRRFAKCQDWKINEKEVGLANRLLLAVLYPPPKSPPQEGASSELITLLASWEESL